MEVDWLKNTGHSQHQASPSHQTSMGRIEKCGTSQTQTQTLKLFLLPTQTSETLALRKKKTVEFVREIPEFPARGPRQSKLLQPTSRFDLGFFKEIYLRNISLFSWTCKFSGISFAAFKRVTPRQARCLVLAVFFCAESLNFDLVRSQIFLGKCMFG